MVDHTCDVNDYRVEGTELGEEEVWNCSVCKQEMIRSDKR